MSNLKFLKGRDTAEGSALKLLVYLITPAVKVVGAAVCPIADMMAENDIVFV